LQPVNLKFCFEGMEESGSIGLEELLHERKETEFLKKVEQGQFFSRFF
jgi:acetylornithine deacetylase/succinyl-diaminopimelate desuccinylase-like protein